MAVYTYKCNNCHKDFELLIGVNQESAGLVCPYCKSKDLIRTFSSFLIRGLKKASSSCSSCSSSNCSSCSSGR
ncbi:MAG: zinc ribbon domain-containing protein [Candidatus Omnitrophota bacterium]|nr:MAG: zinc ribbon domain-containing protein [Candidatus Omnitrophota bacterium]